jgi:hypothetical protein
LRVVVCLVRVLVRPIRVPARLRSPLQYYLQSGDPQSPIPAKVLSFDKPDPIGSGFSP